VLFRAGRNHCHAVCAEQERQHWPKAMPQTKCRTCRSASSRSVTALHCLIKLIATVCASRRCGREDLIDRPCSRTIVAPPVAIATRQITPYPVLTNPALREP
jgi:hypothetical protein